MIVLYFGIIWAHKKWQSRCVIQHFRRGSFMPKRCTWDDLFSTRPLLFPFEFLQHWKEKVFLVVVAALHSTLVYRTVSISDISLPRLKIKWKMGFNALEDYCQFGIWSKLESSKHNISISQKYMMETPHFAIFPLPKI